MAEGAPNFTFLQALEAYNNDQVMTQTMWYIQVSPPENYNAQSSPNLSQMQIYGQNFTVPGRTNEFAEVNYRGYPIPTPTVLKMDQQHTVTINCDVHQQLRRGFLDWQACAIDPSIGSQTVSFASDRRPTAGVGTGQLRLYLLAPNYETCEQAITMHGVRVENVGSITLSHQDGGIATFEVGFRSVYWEFDNADNSGAESSVDKVGGEMVGGLYQAAAETGPMNPTA